MSSSIEPGTVLRDRWRVTGVLGSGCFGQVFRAEDISEVGLGHQILVGHLDSGQYQAYELEGGIDVRDVAPGATAQVDDADTTLFDVSHLDIPPVDPQCVVVAVEIEEAL